MKKLGNVLYVTTPQTYLALDGETVVIRKEEEELRRIPLHNLEGIVAFGYTGASPKLMGACAQRNIALSFLTPNGKFLARIVGPEYGNVILRKTQYRLSDDEKASTEIAKRFIIGKIYNCRWVLERAIRDHAMRLDLDKLKTASQFMAESIRQAEKADGLAQLRGFEGEAATRYFYVFDDLILQQKDSFQFTGRNRRPPLDRVNALLSFFYTLLAHDTASALSAVGLDPYVGFLHRDRPGRQSLALDLMEELRPVMADRFVISLINKREIKPDDFIQKENGAVFMKEEARKSILTKWQTRKQEMITHPYLNEKIPWGLAPHAQALLLTRFLRGDLDDYPPFLWK